MNARLDTPITIGYPSVSVVVPVYDNPQGVASFLDALRGQTYPCFYVVVAGDTWAGLVASGTRRYIYEVSVIEGLNLVAFVLGRWPLAMSNSTCRWSCPDNMT